MTGFTVNVKAIFSFQSYDKMVKATKEELSLCPGFGPQKV